MVFGLFQIDFSYILCYHSIYFVFTTIGYKVYNSIYLVFTSLGTKQSHKQAI